MNTQQSINHTRFFGTTRSLQDAQILLAGEILGAQAVKKHLQPNDPAREAITSMVVAWQKEFSELGAEIAKRAKKAAVSK